MAQTMSMRRMLTGFVVRSQSCCKGVQILLVLMRLLLAASRF